MARILPHTSLNPSWIGRKCQHLLAAALAAQSGPCAVWHLRRSAPAPSGTCVVRHLRCLAPALSGTCAVRHLRPLGLRAVSSSPICEQSRRPTVQSPQALSVPTSTQA
jgi:hypothetical protein